jgi:putative component of toxin-antitoxin plasmid stabilization module
MAIRLISLYVGRVKRVVLLALSAECPAEEFLDEVFRLQPKEHAKLVNRIHMVADNPLLRNHEIFKHERDGIYVWKTHHGFRLYAFQDESHLIVAVNGGDKKSDKKQTRDIDRALEYRAAYLNAKATGRTIPIQDHL